MSDNFDKAFKIVVGEEGGYVNNPKDPGGETKFGISNSSYPTLDIKNLTIDQAKDIYRRNYWNRVDGDEFPYEIALPLFDAAINEGVSEAIIQLQQAAGVTPDGVMGHNTIEAVKSKDPDQLLALFMAREFNFKTHLKIWLTFGLGWLRRGFRIVVQAIRG